ncbi:MAG: ATP-dependent helicase [Treponemataceae bacterium]|nr:ATP-dependent helicase [Treponemataceae bacterium]
MNIREYLTKLNPEQVQAVQHEGSPLLILAGAGSGKTSVITAKIAYLIAEKGIRPSQILAVTFTKKAASEMMERAIRLEPLASKAQIRTFHSFGSWFLRFHAAEVGISSNFTVYDDSDMVTLVSKAVPSLQKKNAAHYAHLISLAKDYCLAWDSPELAELDSDPDFPEIYRQYENRLRETGNVDFGDLIMLPVILLQENESLRAYMHSRFRVIMVDEYQDSNVAQFKLLQALAGEDTYVCVVGDDDQSIYRFRGAEVQNILTFQDHFPGTQIIKLVRNYRSVAPILSNADSVVSNNKGRLGKNLVSVRGEGGKPQLFFFANQDEESAFCSDMIREAHKKGCPYSDWAILYRTNAQSLNFETEFMHKKIPYSVVGSLKFYEREEVKDALAVISFLVNPRDELSFRRIVNKPPRGVGDVTQDKIIAKAAENRADVENLVPKLGLVEACLDLLPSLPKKARASLKEFLDTVSELSAMLGDEEPDFGSFEDDSDTTPDARVDKPGGAETAEVSDGKVDSASVAEVSDAVSMRAVKGAKATSLFAGDSPLTLADFIEEVVKKTGLLEYHEAQDEIAGTQKVANLQELYNSAAFFDCSRKGLLDFLDHIELDRAAEDNSDDTSDAVTLITLHNTKGLEFPRVIITGMETGVFPRADKTEDELEEERRLFYVGITRAKDELYFTSCASRRLYGRTDFMEVSPFLMELDAENLEVYGRQPAAFRRNFQTLHGDVGSGSGAGSGSSRSGRSGTGSGAGFGKDASRFGASGSAANSENSRFSSGSGSSARGRVLNTNAAADDDFDDELETVWRKGKRVYHDDFGYGYITNAMYSDEGMYIITVAFECGRKKSFMPAYQSASFMLCGD